MPSGAVHPNITRHDTIRPKPLKQQREFAQLHSEVFIEIEPAGAPFTAPSPRVIGTSNSRTLGGIARSIFVGCVKDARVRGRSGFIELDEVVLHEFQSDELDRIDDRLDFDPAIFEGTKEAVSIITPGPQAEVVELEAAFMLIGPHSHDFGHWIWEYLPKYIAATQSGAVPTVPILIDAGMPVSHRRALELLLPEGGAIFPVAAYQPVLVHHLWFAPGQIYLPVCEERNDRLKWDYYAAPPVRFAPIIREMAQRIDRKFGGDERKFDSDRIFLARQAWRRRKLLNHAAIEAIASARRFRIVYPDELDFETQVRLLRSTRYVVGPNGSALYLTFFCRPGTRLCVLSNPYTLPSQAEQTSLLAGIQIEVTVITGPSVTMDPEYPDFDDFLIDEALFNNFLDRWVVDADC